MLEACTSAFLPRWTIQCDVASAYYIPCFISKEEETYLLRQGNQINEYPNQRWETLLELRVGPYILGRLRSTGAFGDSPHKGAIRAILNELSIGDVQPHEDDPAYHPVVATISLSFYSVFHYFRYSLEEDSKAPIHDERHKGRSIYLTPVFSVFLEPRSVIITGNLYTSHLHGIDGVTLEDEVIITNWQNIKNDDMREIVHGGGTLLQSNV
ncbi:hypothetical protein SCLCIDRAFT_16047 [Scleroderma citrinum Foug A]|uniref:Fe2OG dioxygenase domain-containing protein n=1 Tax=Scleroderma citrinum Foug A TaxID=1036808 RepID=A0A0C3DMG9_9AGAM|nr:hypothetical protein SCLCIDRAFT_16047 [Scleroderma citrinum Foug A]